MVSQGGTVIAVIQVKNTGNVNWMGIVGISLTGPQVIDGEFSVAPRGIGPGETAQVTLRIHVPTNAIPGTYTLIARTWGGATGDGTYVRSEGIFNIFDPGTAQLNTMLYTRQESVSVGAPSQNLLAEILNITLSES